MICNYNHLSLLINTNHSKNFRSHILISYIILSFTPSFIKLTNFMLRVVACPYISDTSDISILHFLEVLHTIHCLFLIGFVKTIVYNYSITFGKLLGFFSTTSFSSVSTFFSTFTNCTGRFLQFWKGYDKSTSRWCYIRLFS